ncbi:hypothetical protein PRZ48_013191 [Zasmidium cellare]|uniref:Uncharacterized protein n=1 Tax=Zasmidium cellare TaxID=395010 RepID=A0ABR0E3U4_ZASCE|nr:hypothetical protein PRZ48_013191 [Zasmidium cellare]
MVLEALGSPRVGERKGGEVFRGASAIPWATLAHAVHWVSHRKFEESMSAIPGFEAKLTMINNMVQLRDNPNEHDELEELLSLNFHFNASNPWDRVYALLGVWNPLKPGGFSEQNVEGFTVDYSRALKDVYAQATFTAMMRSGQLALMSFVSVGAQTHDEDQWPSWVPRWDRAAGLAQAGYTEACFNLTSSSIAGPQEVCHYSKEGNVLHVRGLTVGNIAFALDLTPLAALHRQGSQVDTAFDSLRRAWSKRSNPKEKLDQVAKSLQPLKGTQFRLGTASWCVRDLATLFLQALERTSRSWPGPDDLLKQFALAGGDVGDATGLANALSGFADSLGSLSFAQLDDESFGFCVGDVEEGDEEHRQIFRNRDRLKEESRTFSII